MTPLLIVNPQSGGGRTGRTFAAMRAPIARALGAVDVAMTERRGHAITLAEAAAAEGRPLIVAVGGDGTFNEVVNGVMRSGRAADVAVGLVAQGTGGDFRRTLGLEHRLDRYLEALASGRERAIDVGRFRYRPVAADSGPERAEHWFVNILSAGMGGLVDRYVETGSRALGGKAAYFVASLRALADSMKGDLVARVTRAGQTEELRLSSYMVAVCNGQYFGSGMHVAPMAAIDDGLLDVVSIGGEGKLGFALTARKVYDGGHLRAPGSVHVRAERVVLDLVNDAARPRFLIDCDGEPLGCLPLEIDLVPRALRLRA